jgi:pyridoxal phosphate enzyme (YggS family)
MSDIAARLRENLERVRSRIADACRRCGRNPAQVRLIAVTKYAELDGVRELIALGQTVLGESRPQQLVARALQLGTGIEWHLIGTLQRNKVRSVLPHVSLIHSVESLKLLERIDSIAAELNVRPRVLLQVNVSGEASKQGFEPERLRETWPAISAHRNVTIVGLMTMAPLADDPRHARPTFSDLRRLRDELRQSAGDAALFPELSMGMSNDFEVAIEEGATLVRIGSLLFEGLKAPEGDGS